MSGHIFFKERWFGFDDGTYAGARLLEIVSRAADASAVLNALPTSFSTPELNVKCEEGQSHGLVDQLVALASPAGGDAGNAVRTAIATELATLNPIDGLRVDWADGFGLIRASNTTPVLVLRFEGHTQAALDRIQVAMLELLHTVKPDASFAEAAH
jgi:phosphomannomutase